jgi:hypothetical protein
MTYEYIGSGSIKTKGCADTSRHVFITYKWSENSILFVKKKSMNGILEKIAIKRVILNVKNGFSVIPIYQDTLNSLWNENELVIEQDARDFAIAYWEQQRDKIIERECPAV